MGTAQSSRVAEEVDCSNRFKNGLVIQLLVLHPKLTETNKLSGPSPPWTELCVLGGVLVTWYRRLLPSLLQRPGLSLFKCTVGVIPVSPSKSRSLLPVPAHTKVRNLDEAEQGCRVGRITPPTAEYRILHSLCGALSHHWCSQHSALNTQTSPRWKKTTLKRA